MKHITDQEILAYYSRTLRREEELALLNHTAQCSYCAGRLASSFPEEELITPPPDLQQQILQSAQRMVSSRKKQNRELYSYSTRVVLAMGMTLLLLVSSNFITFPARLIFTTNVTAEDYSQLAEDAREKGSKKQESIRKKTAKRVEKIASQREDTNNISDTVSSWSNRLVESLFGEKQNQNK